jgi:C4-dicarboxylate-specific signal transduction histidine kinase
VANSALLGAAQRIGRNRALTILGVALALVVTVVTMGHFGFRSMERTVLNDFAQRELVMAREASHGIEFYFRMIAMALRPMASDADVLALKEDAVRHDLGLKAQELKAFGVRDVGIIDAQGVLRYSAWDPPAEGSDFSSRSYFQEAKQGTSADVRVIEFIEFEGIPSPNMGLLLGVPMFHREEEGAAAKFAGLVACVVDVAFLAQEFVAPIQVGTRGHALLIDSEGIVLWSVDHSQLGKSVLTGSEDLEAFQQVVAKMMAGEEGTAEYQHYAHDESDERHLEHTEAKLIAYTPVSVAKEPWSVGVYAPKADALRELSAAHRMQHLVVGFSTLIILAGAAGAMAICARLRGMLGREVSLKTTELAASWQRLQVVLNSLDALVYVADLETHEVLFHNRRVRELFGDVVGRNCWDILGVAADGQTSADALVTDGVPSGVQVWSYRLGEEPRWYEVHDRAIAWEGGRLVRLEIAMDVTERRRQEEQIIQQNRELQEKKAVIEKSRNELAEATEKVSELIETAAQEQVLGNYFENPHLVACWQTRKCENESCPCYGKEPMRCWQTEGTLCHEEWPASFSEKVLICRDCEVYCQSCPNRLTQLAEGFNNMMHLLRHKVEEMRQLRYHALQRERMASIGQMAAGIAHEIDNPIASLFSLVQLLKRSDLDDEAKARVALMQQCIERISKTVRQVVDFGRPIGHEEWVFGDVTKCVEDTVNLLRYDRRARKVEILLDIEPDLPSTMIIEHQLQQVFMNIMVNALDAMGGEGTIRVRGRSNNGALEFSVADTGEGMRPDQIQHIFEPFYTTKAGKKGTGLGLALSFSTVQRHGGTIRVESEAGKGSTFVISIPLKAPDGDSDASSQNPGR